MRTLFFSFLALSVAQHALASDVAKEGFYADKAQGWYWYDDPKNIPAKKPPAPQIIIPAPTVVDNPKPEEKPPVFSTAWLTKALDATRVRAIDNPSNPDGTPSKDMIAYMYLQRIALDKSQNFANAAERAVQSDPLLDENNRVPFDTAAVAFYQRIWDVDKKAAMNALSQKAGLWFFFDSKCRFCALQYEILNRFIDKTHFTIRYISTDNKPLPGMTSWLPDRGQAKLLNLKITPTLVMVTAPKNFYVLSQGMASEETITKKILLAASTANLLPKELKAQVQPYDKDVITPQQMQKSGLEKQMQSDPNAFVDYIRTTLRGD